MTMRNNFTEAEEKALEIHTLYKLKFPVNLESLCHELNLKLQYLPMEDVVSGMIVMHSGQGDIVVNKLQHPNRQRFTISHEIGHFILHSGKQSEYVDKLTRHRHAGTYEQPTEEVEANQFAAELLMPRFEIEKLVDEREIWLFDDVVIKLLAEHFGVSAQAMTIRLKSLGYIPDWAML